MPQNKIKLQLDNIPAGGFYSSGETISGHVVIRIYNDTKSSGLKVTFVGKCITEFSERRGKSNESFNDAELYFKRPLFLFGDGQTFEALSAGAFTFPFSYQLPNDILYPDTFTSENGIIEYYAEGYLQLGAFQVDLVTRQEFRVRSPFSWNLYPNAGDPAELVKSKTFSCLCLESPPMSMVVRLEKRGYYPGEIIVVEGEVDNASNRRITHYSAELIQCVFYNAEGHWKVIEKELCAGRCQADQESIRIVLKVPSELVVRNFMGSMKIRSRHILNNLKISPSHAPSLLEPIPWPPSAQSSDPGNKYC